eukprot:PhF_6_TR4403/c0_g1_i1/m.5948/K05606/MCEE, epi; methylmalonyl-CoA/ethylmalonyl-CoA epimerase
MFRRCVTRCSLTPSSLQGIGRLNHVAIAVPATKPLAQAANMYKVLFNAQISEPLTLPEHGVTTVFVEFNNTKIELLHPHGDKSPIAKFLDQNKDGGMHHICIEVPDIAASIAKVKELGIRPLSEKPKIGAHGLPVVFLHPKDCGGVLVEMEEHKP